MIYISVTEKISVNIFVKVSHFSGLPAVKTHRLKLFILNFKNDVFLPINDKRVTAAIQQLFVA
jgi:hypothetical protein